MQKKSQSKADWVEISGKAQRLFESRSLADRGAKAGRKNDAVTSLSRNLIDVGVVENSGQARKIAEKVMTKVEEEHQLEQSRLQEIREKLENDFYSSKQVAEAVAERLQEEMNLR